MMTTRRSSLSNAASPPLTAFVAGAAIAATAALGNARPPTAPPPLESAPVPSVVPGRVPATPVSSDGARPATMTQSSSSCDLVYRRDGADWQVMRVAGICV